MTPGILALIAASLAFIGFGRLAYETAHRWTATRERGLLDLTAIGAAGAFIALVVMWLVVTGRIFA